MAKSTVNVDSYADLGRYYLPDRQKIDDQVRKKIDDKVASSEIEIIKPYNDALSNYGKQMEIFIRKAADIIKSNKN